MSYHLVPGIKKYLLGRGSEYVNQIFWNPETGEMATKNNAMIPESDEKPQTEQQVHSCLDVHLCNQTFVTMKNT